MRPRDLLTLLLLAQVFVALPAGSQVTSPADCTSVQVQGVIWEQNGAVTTFPAMRPEDAFDARAAYGLVQQGSFLPGERVNANGDFIRYWHVRLQVFYVNPSNDGPCPADIRVKVDSFAPGAADPQDRVDQLIPVMLPPSPPGQASNLVEIDLVQTTPMRYPGTSNAVFEHLIEARADDQLNTARVERDDSPRLIRGAPPIFYIQQNKNITAGGCPITPDEFCVVVKNTAGSPLSSLDPRMKTNRTGDLANYTVQLGSNRTNAAAYASPFRRDDGSVLNLPELEHTIEWRLVPESPRGDPGPAARLEEIGTNLFNLVNPPGGGSSQEVSFRTQPRFAGTFLAEAFYHPPAAFRGLASEGPRRNELRFTVDGPDLTYASAPELRTTPNCITAACDPAAAQFTLTLFSIQNTQSIPINAQWRVQDGTGAWVDDIHPYTINLTYLTDGGRSGHVKAVFNSTNLQFSNTAADDNPVTGQAAVEIKGQTFRINDLANSAAILADLQGNVTFRLIIDYHGNFSEIDEENNVPNQPWVLRFVDRTPPRITNAQVLTSAGATLPAGGFVEGDTINITTTIEEPGKTPVMSARVEAIDSAPWNRTVSLACSPASPYVCTGQLEIEGTDVLKKVRERFRLVVTARDEANNTDTETVPFDGHQYLKISRGCFRPDRIAPQNGYWFGIEGRSLDDPAAVVAIPFNGTWTSPRNEAWIRLFLEPDIPLPGGEVGGARGRGTESDETSPSGIFVTAIAPNGVAAATNSTVAQDNLKVILARDIVPPGSPNEWKPCTGAADVGEEERDRDPAFLWNSTAKNVSLRGVGVWSFLVNVTDVNGKVNTTTILLNITDATDPTIAAPTCELGRIRAGETITCSARADDNIHVARVLTRFIHEAGTVELVHRKTADVTGPEEAGTYAADATSGRAGLLPWAGRYTVETIVEDEGGRRNQTRYAEALELQDDRAPVITLTTQFGPLDGLEVEAADNLTFEMRIDDETLERDATLLLRRGTETISVPLMLGDDLVWRGNLTTLTHLGEWTASATVRDYAAHTGSATATFRIVADTYPQALLVSPSVRDAMARGVLAPSTDVVIELLDPGQGVDRSSVRVLLDGRSVQAQVQDVPGAIPRVRITFRPLVAADDHLDDLLVEVFSADLGGRNGTRQIPLVVDAQAPTVELSIEPGVGEDTPRVGPASEITVDATDTPAGVNSTRLRVRAGSRVAGAVQPVGSPLLQGTYTGAVAIGDLPGLTGGSEEVPLVIEAWGRDRVGNEGTPTRRDVILDRRGPDLQLAAPGASEEVRYRVVDPSGVSRAELQFWTGTTLRSTRSMTHSGDDVWAATLPLYPKGTTVFFQVTGYDTFGNAASDLIRNFTAGNNPPTIRIESPREGQPVTGTIAVRWRASDAETAPEQLVISIFYRAAGAPANMTIATDLRGNQASIDTRRLPNGPGVLTVTVSDGSRIGEDHVSIVVSNIPSPVLDVTAPRQLERGGQAVIEVTLTGSASDVRAVVRDSNGNVSAETDLFDDGEGVDAVPNDGRWSGAVVLTEPGTYTVDIHATTPDGPSVKERAATIEVLPGPSGPGVGPGVIVLLVATVAVIALGVLVVRRWQG